MKKADYGIDAPGVIRTLLMIGLALLLLGIGVARFAPGLAPALGWVVWPGAFLVLEAVAMLWSSKVGKRHARDALLDRLKLNGDEQVLDVGCGHGLLLIGAAKRLPRGKATGLDLWSQVDQGSNSSSATLENAALEGVAERVEVQDGDMRKMPFPDASFDVVVSNLALHNIPDAAGRAEAVREIVRVLKPGGQVSLMDFQKTREYAATLRAAGLSEVRRSLPSFWITPPVWTVTARR